MKLFCYFQAVALVSAGPAFGNRGERCQNVIDFFKRDRVIRNDSKLMKKMVAKADNFIDMMKHAEGACKESSGRNVADFDDDIDRTVNESNVFDKIEACYERFGNYIDQKIPTELCPNSHARITRVLRRMNGTMRKAAEARTKRVLAASLRSNQSGGMSKEDQAAKQEAKSDKRENKEANAAVIAEKQAVKMNKQSNKAADREMKQAKTDMKAENQAEKAAKQAEKVEKQEGKAEKQEAKSDKRDRKAERPLKEKDGKDKDGKASKDKNVDEAQTE